MGGTWGVQLFSYIMRTISVELFLIARIATTATEGKDDALFLSYVYDRIL
jgi:hypothetical protein